MYAIINIYFILKEIKMKKYTAREFLMIMLKHALIGGAMLAVFAILSKYFGSLCPTYRIFGICCPFCGMTRAHLAALRLELDTALYYNPTFFLGIPCLFFMIHDKLFAPKYDKFRKISAGVLLCIIIAAYIARVILYGFDFFE